MSLIDERAKTATAIAEGRFIDFVLKDKAADMDAAIKSNMSSFSSSFWSQRDFSIQNNILTYTSLKNIVF
jgi:hypothetical protein